MRGSVAVRAAMVLVLLLVWPSSPRAEPVWEPAGFGGAGNFLTLAFDPVRPDLLYATSDVAGVMRSEDGGNTWVFANEGLGNYEVSSLAIDPLAPDTLYAGAGGFSGAEPAGLYKSLDGGRSWRHLTRSAALGIDFRVHRTPRAIAPHPARRDRVLSGSRSKGLWLSEDGGETWTQVLRPPRTTVRFPRPVAGSIVDDPSTGSYPAPLTALVHDPAEPDRVYAGFYGDGVWVSEQAGDAGTWVKTSTGLPGSARVLDLAAGPGGRLYAALAGVGVYRSDDRGALWRPASGGLPLAELRVFSLAVDASDPDRVFFSQEPLPRAGEQYRPVWISRDGGASWKETGATEADRTVNPTEAWRYPPSESWRVALDPHRPERLFFTEPWGLYRTEDSGKTWQAVVRGAQNTCVTDLAFVEDAEAEGGARLLASHMDAGLLSSTDRGETWKTVLPRNRAQYRPRAGHAWRVLVQGERTFLTLAPWHLRKSLLLSTEDNQFWDVLLSLDAPEGDRGDRLLMLAADPRTPERLYASQDGGPLLISDDAGRTWRESTGAPPLGRRNDLLVDGTGRIFLAGFRDGLWRSPDEGTTWERVLPGLDLIWDLELADGTLYAAAEDGNLHRSEDGGRGWQRLTDFLPETARDGAGNQGMAVAIDPRDPERLLFSRVDHWHFADGGDGLYESRDGGRSWRPLNAGLGQTRVRRLAFAPDGTLYAGTWCGGLWRLNETPGESPPE